MPNPMIPNPEREAKLPAWARDLVADLRRVVGEASRERDDAVRATSPETSDAVMDVGRGVVRQYVGIPSYRGQVRFLVDGPGQIDGRYVEVYVGSSDDADRRGIEVRGSDGIVIRPRSGNLVEIEVSRR